jgi:hypothetical protein
VVGERILLALDCPFGSVGLSSSRDINPPVSPFYKEGHRGIKEGKKRNKKIPLYPPFSKGEQKIPLL